MERKNAKRVARRKSNAHLLGYKYKVLCKIQAHSGDVRAVAEASGATIVTGSRDTLVKLYTPDSVYVPKNYNETRVFCGATNYVSSLCVLPASEQYPHGLILAGSSDCAIYGFAVNHTEPVMKLLGHSDNVCALSRAGPFGSFVSGSWDKTARVWSGQQCLFVLTGHQQAVWAAEFLDDEQTVITASADHTIRMWRKGICEKVFKGHTDCVRGLEIYFQDEAFYSCSNDGTIRKWQTHDEESEIVGNHSSFIYGITTLSVICDYATCGEDNRVKLWSMGKLCQTLFFPGKTLWSIRYIKTNGYLAVGCSDGTLLILGKAGIDEDVPEEEFEFEQDIAPEVDLDKEVDLDNEVDLDKEGFDLFHSQGEFDGQHVVCFEQATNCMAIYEWDSAGNQWKKKDLIADGNVGNIVEKAKSLEPNGQGNTINFDVDVEGTMCQLSFEKGDNPYVVAQNFVAEHNLSEAHVSQIADFIIRNIYNDKWNPLQNLFVNYPNGNVGGLGAKLSEFNSKVSKEHQLSEQKLEHLKELASAPSEVTVEQMTALDIALMWEDEFLFPVLDLVRLAVKSVGMHCQVGNPGFINRLLHVLTESKVYVNRNLIIKTFCNMFGYAEGNKMLVKFYEKIICSVRDLLQAQEYKIEKAGTALFLNYALLFNADTLNVDVPLYCTSIMAFINSLTDSEAIYRILVAISNVVDNPELNVGSLNSPEFIDALCKFKAMGVPKSEELLEMLLLRFEITCEGDM